MPGSLFTTGHSNRSAGALVALLREGGVECVADVRRHPASRRHPQFNRSELEAALRLAGLDYQWLGEALGGHREARLPVEQSANRAWQEEAFRAYADAMDQPGFQEAVGALESLALARPSALLCAERDWRYCHRQLLADLLLVRGWQVIHLLEPGRHEEHRLHPYARVEAGRLSYPGLL
jgi:uncharacterized protein (DUF488 family)